MAADDERRRNIKAILIAGAIMLLPLAFAYRPATVIGIHGDALVHSLGGGDLIGESSCKQQADDLWRCIISEPHGSGSGSVTYFVETRAFGCWDAVRRGPQGQTGGPTVASGCINLIDVASPF